MKQSSDVSSAVTRTAVSDRGINKLKRRSKFSRIALTAAGLAVAAGLLARLLIASITWWIDFAEAPVKSDVMVVLAGSYGRPPYAADLYARGYAPAIWVERTKGTSGENRLAQMGVIIPKEEEIDGQILRKLGVPTDRIRLYGNGTISTVDEALMLRREFPPRGKKILIVTSRYHARRARMIFRRYLPEAEIHVAATPYENFQRDWWRDRELAQLTFLEAAKTLYFFCGGSFVSKPR